MATIFITYGVSSSTKAAIKQDNTTPSSALKNFRRDITNPAEVLLTVALDAGFPFTSTSMPPPLPNPISESGLVTSDQIIPPTTPVGGPGPFFQLIPQDLAQLPGATLLSQYDTAPSMVQLIENAAIWFDPTAALQSFYNNIWNVYVASGYGLDVWGRIVGINRVLTVNLPGEYVGFTGPGNPLSQSDWSGKPLGDFVDEAIFYTNEGVATANFSLTDESYRTLIFAKALYNISDCSAPSINRVLNLLFGPTGLSPVPESTPFPYVADNQDLSVTYTFGSAPTPFQLAIIQSGVIPNPVGININQVSPSS